MFVCAVHSLLWENFVRTCSNLFRPVPSWGSLLSYPLYWFCLLDSGTIRGEVYVVVWLFFVIKGRQHVHDTSTLLHWWTEVDTACGGSCPWTYDRYCTKHTKTRWVGKTVNWIPQSIVRVFRCLNQSGMVDLGCLIARSRSTHLWQEMVRYTQVCHLHGGLHRLL